MRDAVPGMAPAAPSCPLISAAALLLILHGVDGREVWVAPDQITSLRSPGNPRGTHFPSNTECLITLTDGKFIAVLETCDRVRQRVEENK